MEYPRFLVLESSSYEEDAYPIAAAWSIASGELKAILIRPEDEWQQWDSTNEDSHGITRQMIEMQGESVLDVLREMSEDFDKQPVFVTEPYLYEKWLDTMYQSYDSELPFELVSVEEMFKMPNEELEEELINISNNLLLDIKVSEERVRCMLELFHRLTVAGVIEPYQ
jgi:hypothetical protein